MTATHDATPFGELMSDAMHGAARFGHREHIHVTWLAVRRFGIDEAVGVVSDGLQRTTRYAGVPQKYNATVSRAWVELVDRREVVGALVRTRKNVKPMYISVGHRIDLPGAVHWVLACAQGYRLPEPTRRAHNAAAVAE